MAMDLEKIKQTPDSQIVFGNQRAQNINEFAEKQFGACLIRVKVNREQKCFDVFVKDAQDEDIDAFEKLLTMCKVYPLQSVKRKK